MADAETRARAAVIGALVADAASMGLHWLYDQEALARIGGAAPEFRPPVAADYEGKGYFAHGGKRPGDISHYGAQMLAMSSALAGSGAYDAEAYAAAFHDWFGYGGRWVGYIDRPTRATLDAMATAEEGALAACGADDEQLPALSKLPPLVARHHGDADLPDMVASAVRVTNDRDDSVAWGQATARMIVAAIAGAAPAEAVAAARDGATAEITGQIDAAREMADETTAAVAQRFAMHCHLEMAFPVLIHAIATAGDFAGAVRANILAGGDNCGRAIPIGAVLGACFAGDAARGVPADWLARVAVPGEALAGV